MSDEQERSPEFLRLMDIFNYTEAMLANNPRLVEIMNALVRGYTAVTVGGEPLVVQNFKVIRNVKEAEVLITNTCYMIGYKTALEGVSIEQAMLIYLWLFTKAKDRFGKELDRMVELFLTDKMRLLFIRVETLGEFEIRRPVHEDNFRTDDGVQVRRSNGLLVFYFEEEVDEEEVDEWEEFKNKRLADRKKKRDS